MSDFIEELLPEMKACPVASRGISYKKLEG
jgi:hypothetical protein